jgi:hypothetical protein
MKTASPDDPIYTRGYVVGVKRSTPSSSTTAESPYGPENGKLLSQARTLYLEMHKSSTSKARRDAIREELKTMPAWILEDLLM